jgi:hypothetical protein
MRTFLAAAVLLVATSSTSLAVNEFATAGDFVDAYHKSDELLLRLYIRGIGDGIGVYNAMMAESE